jgi:hypothetical protein
LPAHDLTNHDLLNSDGFWDREEIEAIYGVHHVYAKKKSKVEQPYHPVVLNNEIGQDDVEHQKRADHVVDAVLTRIDKNKDGKISPEEFELVGLDGLPDFTALGAEGHHYDVESGTHCFTCPVHCSNR